MRCVRRRRRVRRRVRRPLLTQRCHTTRDGRMIDVHQARRVVGTRRSLGCCDHHAHHADGRGAIDPQLARAGLPLRTCGQLGVGVERARADACADSRPSRLRSPNGSCMVAPCCAACAASGSCRSSRRRESSHTVRAVGSHDEPPQISPFPFTVVEGLSRRL